MRDERLNRRRFVKVSVGGITAAYLALRGPWATAAQTAVPTDLTYKGKVEFWDWEFAPRQAAADELIAQWKEKYP